MICDEKRSLCFDSWLLQTFPHSVLRARSFLPCLAPHLQWESTSWKIPLLSKSFSWEPSYEVMPYCWITLGHSAKDRMWIIIVRLIGNSCTARRKEHHSGRKGHTGGVTIFSGHKQSTLCLHAHVSDIAIHRDRHLKAYGEKAFQQPNIQLMFVNFATGTFFFSPCKSTKIQPACPLSLGARSVGGAIARGSAMRSVLEFWRRSTHELNVPS